MSRQEDFFNESTKQIRDSYVFQSGGTYSDDDVRDIATSLAEHGYQYAVDKACEWMRKHLGAPAGMPQAKSYNDAMNELITEFRNAMKGGEQ